VTDRLATEHQHHNESESLAREMARAYRRMAVFYRDQLELLGPEADARARGTDDSDEEQAADRPQSAYRPPTA